MLRGVVPGISDTDMVLLWGGGIYNWFDPLTLIRAVAAIDRDDVRLVFLGGKHPNPALPAMQMAVQTHALADELGLTGTKVFFNDRWVPVRRARELPARGRCRGVDAPRPRRDGLLVPHPDPRLPVGRSAGGRDRWRRVRRADREPRPGCHRATRRCRCPYAGTRAAARRRHRVWCTPGTPPARWRTQLTWSTVLKPLLDFCDDPHRAPDLVHAAVQDHLRRPYDVVRAPTPGPPGWRGEVALAKSYVDKGGIRLLRHAGS